MSESQDRPSLDSILQQEAGWVIAFSGGVDSSVLLAATAAAVGKDRVLAVIADSDSLARRELTSALRTAASLGVMVEQIHTEEMNDERYRANTGDRCFWCKEALFVRASEIAQERGWALAYGEHADDHDDHRPGAQSAVLREVRAPLVEAGWGKEDIRAFARERDLAVADKLSSPCLASRVAVGQEVSPSILKRIEGIEASLHDRGFALVRARHLGPHQLRLECGEEEYAQAQDSIESMHALAREHGYTEFALAPYRRGSVAAAVPKQLDV
jgi:uncharacterized protein